MIRQINSNDINNFYEEYDRISRSRKGSSLNINKRVVKRKVGLLADFLSGEQPIVEFDEVKLNIVTEPEEDFRKRLTKKASGSLGFVWAFLLKEVISWIVAKIVDHYFSSQVVSVCISSGKEY